MPVTESPVSVRRILRAIALTFLGLCAAVLVLWVLPEAIYWREHRDIRLFAAVTRASYALQEFQDTHGRYPDNISEAPDLSQGVADVRQECQALGHPVEDVQFVTAEALRSPAAGGEVLVLRDSSARPLVVLYDHGRRGVSRSLITRRAARVPDYIEILP